jgi:hypothetical protein
VFIFIPDAAIEIIAIEIVAIEIVAIEKDSIIDNLTAYGIMKH